MKDAIDDVCAASAAYLFNLLPEIIKLPPGEQFDRLSLHFEACLMAYRDCAAGRIPVPSDN